MLKLLESFRKINCMSRNLCINSVLRYCDEQPKFENQGPKKEKRKIRETVVLVTLVDQNDKILGLKPKAESEKLARKLNLSLERVFDTKFGKVYPAYKMVSNTELLKVESKASSAKTLKKLPLNSRISDHDLKVKLQTIRKWIAKNCEVHVAIAGSGENNTSKKSLLNKIQEDMKEESRIIDIREKGDAIKFIILPPKQTPQKSKVQNAKDSNLETT